MKRRSTLVLGALALAGATLLTGNAAATPSAKLTTTMLAKSTFDSTQLSGFARVDDGQGFSKPSGIWLVYLKTHGFTDGYVVDNVIDEGGTTGWHSHAGPSLIFVVRGTVTDYDSADKGCAGREYAAGSSFTDTGGRDVHMLKNNSTGQAETIAVQLLPTGAKRKIDAAAPAGCPAS